MAEPTTATASREPSTLSASVTPTGTRDSAPGPHNDDDSDDDSGGYGGMASYYFVFLMLTLCIIGVVIFLNFRRRRKRRLQMLHGLATQPQDPHHRGRRYWQARWGSQNVSREEGLNEHGEAPPPYVPKRSGEEARGTGEGGQAADGGPAVPMQTLSREEAGLKPPDYEEARGNEDGEDVMRPAHQAEGAGSSSRQA